jgi:hypothetical protein
VKGDFSKIVDFKVTIRKILNMAAAHIEDLRPPPACIFDTLFFCQCPFTPLSNVVFDIQTKYKIVFKKY